MAEPGSDGPSAATVQQIENNVLLHQAIEDLRHIRITTEANHLVASKLAEHATIERVDTLWITMGQLTLLARLTVAALGMLLTSVPLLLLTHTIWRWP